MAADATLKPSCQKSHDNLFFDYVGDHPKWKPVSLTHVEYPKGDYLGFALAWCSLMPIHIIVGMITLIIFRRELHTVTFLGGLFVNEILNMVVKHTLAQARPCANHIYEHSSYGMPSDHSQFMGFFAVYMVLFIYCRLHYSQSTTMWDDLLDNLWKHVVAFGTIALSLAVAFSRVYLRYHDINQISAGLVIGGAMGVAWFIFTQTVLTPMFPVITAWPVAEYLMLRDSTLIPSVMWFEYTQSRAETRKRQRRGSHNSYYKSHSQ
ncbi:dolichyldiphosphatase 1 [Exaiptasia diaphana]|uniref:Dolichyldiphosphatase n=1 Tax=Exaiptasia diaphana TaxID=2652724 RepID=A0A913XMZ4_EXADI|nr:dolichyldiphosphatase 1 [Exaiptasia diaphana]KXJ29550.1 Dolichyldiphosphatase 1 [Exaiptasia diaphana]